MVEMHVYNLLFVTDQLFVGTNILIILFYVNYQHHD